MGTANDSADTSRTEHLVSVCTVVQDDVSVIDQFVSDAESLLSRRYHYYEVLIVDNHSTDGSADKVQELQKQVPNIRLIRLARPYNREIAVRAGLDNAIGDYVVTMDLRSDPLTAVPEMIDLMLAGTDVVLGRSTNVRRTFVHRALAAAGGWLAGLILSVRIEPNTNSLFGFSRRAVNSITRIRSKSRFLRYDSALVAYRRTILPYEQELRRGAQPTRESMLTAITNRIELIVAHSATPLRLAALVGLLAAFLNLLYLGYILAVVLVKDRIVEGWLTTSITSTVMFLLLFSILGVLAEYIARILDESRDRPLYFIEHEASSTVCTYDAKRLNVI